MAGKVIYYIWTFIERFGTNIISLCGNILLSYLLLPEDFGLVATISVFTVMISIFVDCGMTDCLLAKQNATNRDFNTLFFFNVFVGCVICAIYCSISGWVAGFFGHPELKQLMCVFGAGAIVASLNVAQMTKLRYNLEFKKIAIITLSTISLSLLLAVAMALGGLRYWALVALNIGYSAFMVIILVFFSRWNLRWEFDVPTFKEFWKFGVNILLSSIMVQTAQNIYTALIGKYFNPQQAGYVWQAQKLNDTPTNSLERTITNPSFVLIAKETDNAKRCNLIVEAFDVMTFANTMLCMYILALCTPIIDFVFPERWLPVIPILRAFICVSLFVPVCNHLQYVFKIYNHTSIIRNIVIFEKIGFIVVAIITYRFGIVPMILSTGAFSVIALAIYLYFVQKTSGISLRLLSSTFIRNLALGILVAAVTFLSATFIENSFMALCIGTVVFFVVLALVCRRFKPSFYTSVKNKLTSLKARLFSSAN